MAVVDLTQYQELVVQQEVEPLEVFSGFETENRYSIRTSQGDALLYAYEESGFLSRNFLRTHRPLSLQVVDGQRQPVLKAERGFFWFFSHLHVSNDQGRRLGSLQRRFAFLGRRFDLLNASGSPLAEVKGPLFRPNTFFVNRQGREVARITKQWSGVLREGFTSADTFQVRFTEAFREPEFVLLVLATAFAIDLDFFEERDSGRARVRTSRR